MVFNGAIGSSSLQTYTDFTIRNAAVDASSQSDYGIYYKIISGPSNALISARNISSGDSAYVDVYTVGEPIDVNTIHVAFGIFPRSGSYSGWTQVQDDVTYHAQPTNDGTVFIRLYGSSLASAYVISASATDNVMDTLDIISNQIANINIDIDISTLATKAQANSILAAQTNQATSAQATQIINRIG